MVKSFLVRVLSQSMPLDGQTLLHLLMLFEYFSFKKLLVLA